jgi:hypothetical protein
LPNLALIHARQAGAPICLSADLFYDQQVGQAQKTQG